MADDRQQVHQGPALPDPGVRRAEAKAGRTAGFVLEADLAEAEAELRAEVEAADAAALQAAIDAAAAQDEAGTALFEAQFGSVAVGRLAAGTINVAIRLNSPDIRAGSTRIDAENGLRFFQGTGNTNAIRWLKSDGTVRLSMFAGNSGLFVGIPNLRSVGITSYGFVKSHSLEVVGSSATVDGSPIRTFANTSGSRTTSQPTWTGGSGSGPNYTSQQQNETAAGNHNHNVPGHYHTVSI